MKTTIAGIAASVLLAITMPALANGIVLVNSSAIADRLSALRQRMSTFGQSQRRRTLFFDCLKAKG